MDGPIEEIENIKYHAAHLYTDLHLVLPPSSSDLSESAARDQQQLGAGSVGQSFIPLTYRVAGLSNTSPSRDPPTYTICLLLT